MRKAHQWYSLPSIYRERYSTPSAESVNEMGTIIISGGFHNGVFGYVADQFDSESVTLSSTTGDIEAVESAQQVMIAG